MVLLITITITILILSFLVFIHELGHFTAAKLSGVVVKEFSVGFGKSVFQKQYKGTNYKIGLFPLGGYVQLKGEERDAGPGSFRSKPYYIKVFVLIAGVTMNLIFSIIVFTVFLAATGYQFAVPKFTNFNFTNTKTVEEYFPITVYDLDPTLSLAHDLEEDDAIVSINGNKITSFDNFVETYRSLHGEVTVGILDFDTFKIKEIQTEVVPFKDYAPTAITVIGEDSPVKNIFEVGDRLYSINGIPLTEPEKINDILEQFEDTTVTVVYTDTNGEFNQALVDVELQDVTDDGTRIYLGVGLVQYEFGFATSFDDQTNRPAYFIEYKHNILSGASLTYDIFRYQFAALSSMFEKANETGDYSEVANSVGGVPQLGDQVGQVVEFQAFAFLIPLSGLLSLALATFNILPFPALDGGQATVSTIEFITRKNIPDPILNVVNLAGFGFLILLAIAVTVKDIVQLGWI